MFNKSVVSGKEGWLKYTDKTIHKHNHQYISNVRTDKIITYVQSYQYLYTKYYQKADNVKYPFLHPSLTHRVKNPF